jgi:hypothetical protein
LPAGQISCSVVLLALASAAVRTHCAVCSRDLWQLGHVLTCRHVTAFSRLQHMLLLEALNNLLHQYEHTLARLVLMASEDRGELQDSSGDETERQEPPNTDLADPERRIWIFTTAWCVHLIALCTNSLSCAFRNCSTSREIFADQKRQLAFGDITKCLQLLMTALLFGKAYAAITPWCCKASQLDLMFTFTYNAQKLALKRCCYALHAASCSSQALQQSDLCCRQTQRFLFCALLCTLQHAMDDRHKCEPSTTSSVLS